MACAGGNGIQHVLVAALVGPVDDLEIVDATVGAKGSQGFIFGTAVGRNLAIHRHLALAAHRAGVTAPPGGQQLFFILVPHQLIHVFESALAEIQGRQDSGRVETIDQPRRAAMLQINTGRMRSDFFGQFAAELHQPRAVECGRLVALAAAHGDGPQILRAHHRAHPVAAVKVAQVVGQTGVAHQVFTRDPDLQHPDLIIAQFRADICLNFRRVAAP